MAKKASKQSSGDLANSSFHDSYFGGSDQSYAEPTVCGMEVLAKLEETGIPCPGPRIPLKTMVCWSKMGVACACWPRAVKLPPLKNKASSSSSSSSSSSI